MLPTHFCENMTAVKLDNLEKISRRFDVVCAVIQRDGLVLAAQRSEVMSLPSNELHSLDWAEADVLVAGSYQSLHSGNS